MAAGPTDRDTVTGYLRDLQARLQRLERFPRPVSASGAFLPLTGGTISGALTVAGVLTASGGISMPTNGVMTWPLGGTQGPPLAGSPAVGRRLVLWPNTVGPEYAIGMDSAAMWYGVPTGAQHRFYIGTTQIAYVHGGGIDIPGQNYFGFNTYGGGWYMSDTIWIRSLANKSVWLGSGNFGTDGLLTIGYGGGTNAAYKVYVGGAGFFNNSLTTAVIFQSLYVKASQTYDSSQVYINPGQQQCTMGFHHGGSAVVLLTRQDNGNRMFFRDYLGANYIDIYAFSFIVSSSRRFKKNVERWQTERGALALIEQMEPITYHRSQPDIDLPLGRRHDAYQRLKRHLERKGRPEYQLPEHVCDDAPCDGSNDHPCLRSRGHHKQFLGVLAEQIEELVPEAVHHSNDGVEGIDPMALLTVAITAIQELSERVKTLEAA